MAHLIPSTAADIIPPAYPAPSPQGYIPAILLTKFSFLGILTGEELRVSKPVKMLSGLAKPLSFVSKYASPSFKVVATNSGKISFKLDKVTPGK